MKRKDELPDLFFQKPQVDTELTSGFFYET